MRIQGEFNLNAETTGTDENEFGDTYMCFFNLYCWLFLIFICTNNKIQKYFILKNILGRN